MILYLLSKAKTFNLLAFSATMFYNVSVIESTIRCLKTAKLPCSIIVGGQAFNTNDNLWQTIGADALVFDIQSAVNISNKLFNLTPSNAPPLKWLSFITQCYIFSFAVMQTKQYRLCKSTSSVIWR